MKYTPCIRSIDEIKKIGNFDVWCVGSDQVWNPVITNGFDDVFTLNISLNSKKISYASSMGSCELSNYSDKTFLQSLEQFDCISVRENVALNYLQKRINRPIKKVIDPTFLMGKSGWQKSLENQEYNELMTEKYVLIYALGGDFEKNKSIALSIAKRINAKVYAITLSNRNKGVDRIISDATPYDFVRYIQNASFVVTNSFHGTCFSLMMGTPFLSVRFGTNPARAEELLSYCKLEHRLQKNDKLDQIDILLDNEDVLKAQAGIALFAEESKEWLKRAVYE